MANEWIREFLSFLPILGFKKSPTILPTLKTINTVKNTNVIKLMFNDILITGLDNREVLIKLLKLIGLQKIEKECSDIFGTSLKLNTTYNKQKYGSCHELIENNNKYYLYLNISKNDLCKKIIKIKNILKLNIEFI